MQIPDNDVIAYGILDVGYANSRLNVVDTFRSLWKMKDGDID